MKTRMLPKFPLWVLIFISWSLTGCGSYVPPQVWEFEIKRFESQDSRSMPEENQILFIGSSTIRKWNTLEEDMDPLPIIQRGFGGSTMNDAVHYAHRIVTPYNPNLIVLYAGDNDLALKVKPEKIVEKYLEFIEIVKTEIPDTPIYFVSIKPSVDRWELWDIMVETNNMVIELSEADPLLHYIDIATPMLDENSEVNPDLFVGDELHLNAAGYEIWTDTIKPVLEDAYPYEP